MLEGAATTLSPGDDFFDSLNPREWFGVHGPESPATEFPGIARSAGPQPGTVTAPLWSPQNPLFAFGVLLAVTTGLVAFSTSFKVRAGKQRAGITLDAGKA